MIYVEATRRDNGDVVPVRLTCAECGADLVTCPDPGCATPTNPAHSHARCPSAKCQAAAVMHTGRAFAVCVLLSERPAWYSVCDACAELAGELKTIGCLRPQRWCACCGEERPSRRPVERARIDALRLKREP